MNNAVVSANTVRLNFDSLYEMMLHNQFYLPSKKCAFVTTEYLIAVKDLRLKVPCY